jgi:uncharacterized protein involved in exopolysaccharide biosynthesis
LTVRNDDMEDMAIDLQDYLRVILRWWMVIIGVFVCAVAGSGAISLRQPPLYSASVTMFEPSYEVVDTPRLYSTDKVYKSYTSLAKSSALEERVLQALEPVLPAADKHPGALLRTVAVVADKEVEAVFDIRVGHTDPELAVQIANTWANEYIEMLDELNTGSATELGFIREELALAETDLEASEQALRAFEEETGLGIAPNQEYGSEFAPVVQDPYGWYGTRGSELKAKNELLASHRLARDNLLLLLGLAEDARRSGQPAGGLPLQLLNVPAISGRGRLSVETIMQAADDPDRVVDLLEAEEQSLASVIDALAPQVEQLHATLMQDKYQYLLLSGVRNTHLERIAVLSRKAQELELEASGAYVISPAVRAVEASPNPWLNVIVAGVLGLCVGVMLAFSLEYLWGLRGQSGK